MSEKVLVKSEQYNLKRIFAIICMCGLLIGVIVAFVLHIEQMQICNEKIAKLTNITIGKVPTYDDLQRLTFWKGRRTDTIVAVAVTAGVIFLVVSGIGAVLYYAWSRIELVVSDKRVYGCAVFGKRVDLPMDSVSAIGSTWPKGIGVATASGRIAFLMIKNRDEIHRCVSNLLIERQSKPVSAPVAIPVVKEVPVNNVEEIKKYKELLDMGIITQEEFDAKKKQLLGL